MLSLGDFTFFIKICSNLFPFPLRPFKTVTSAYVVLVASASVYTVVYARTDNNDL